MKTRLKLFFKWGIQFENAYSISEKAERKAQYADCREVEEAVLDKFKPQPILEQYDATPIFFDETFINDNNKREYSKRTVKTKPQ